MRVLVVGGGGREHAICWSLSKSHAVDRLYAAPGNAGTAQIATSVDASATDVPALVEVAERESIDLTVVGPEAPLVDGLVDELQARGLPVFGPTRDAARIEGSKAWAKSLCERHGIPAGRSAAFDAPKPALAYLDGLEPPFVVKASGLAAGKGVTVTDDRDEARAAVNACLVQGAFGPAGTTILIEEYLEGTEVSALCLTDGRTVAPLAFARDHKRAYDGDRGPNTGGMGASSPVPDIDRALADRITAEILEPTVRAMDAEGSPYRGVLYAGLMLTRDGPKVLEFNCRFGDPETQVILPRLRANLGEVLLACVEGNLGVYRLRWRREACVGVVLASGGYPGSYETGAPIRGLADAEVIDGVNVFHSGTSVRDGTVITAGGRVLTVTALGSELEQARDLAYRACSLISFDGMHQRTDIAGGESA